MSHYFQIRNNDKPVEQHIYSSLERACQALVARNVPDFDVVELDTPGGVVIRRLTLVECKAILRTRHRIEQDEEPSTTG